MSRIIRNFIGGEFHDAQNGKVFDNYCPATGKVYSSIVDSEAEDVNAAVVAAKKAFPGWSSTSEAQRAQFLYKIADGIEARLQEFAEAESYDQGKTVSLARTVDIPRAISNFRFFAGRILHHEEKATVHQDATGQYLNYTVRQPMGVAALISPWNLPLYLATWKVAPAIACGNTCILKPSELSPMTAFLLGEVIRDAKLPPGVVNIIQGFGRTAGQALISHPDVALISFTGGTLTGEHISRTAAPMLKKMSLELGGKNATIVYGDVDLESCVQGTMRAAFANQGEVCLCGSRILVERSIYPRYLARLVEETQKLKVGDPMEEGVFMGALISKDHLEKVTGYVKLAQEEGGKIECGGVRPSNLNERCAGGYFLMPTIISGLDMDARCNTEEIFGPVVTVIPFDTQDEAIAKANGVKYGLSCSIWTQNIHTAQQTAMRLEVGYVWINCWLVRDLRVPFGGMKASGIGREGGSYSIDFYSEVKVICSKI